MNVRTDFPPPPDFDGHEEEEWGHEDYRRSLSDDELAALIAAGIAEPSETGISLSIEQGEAEREAFFSRIATRAGDE